jgi:hypothetical protein
MNLRFRRIFLRQIFVLYVVRGQTSIQKQQMKIYLEPILRHLNLQLQRQRCSGLDPKRTRLLAAL